MSLASHAKKPTAAPAATTAADDVIEGTATTVEDPAPVTAAEPAAEPVAAAEQPAASAAEEKTTTVATSSAPKPPAAVALGSSNVLQDLSQDGFEGLKLGFGAFPGIVLPSEGRFKVNGEEKFLGESFTGVIQGTKAKWIVKVDTTDKDKEKYVYTYSDPRDPNSLTTGGTKVVDFIADQEAAGLRCKVKDYVDVLFELAEVEDKSGALAAGDLVMLSIPDTSIKRLSGYMVQLGMKKKGPRDVVTRVSVGAKVTSVANAYYPWSFKEEKQS